MPAQVGISNLRHRLPAVLLLIPISAMAWLLIFQVQAGRRATWRLTDEVTLEGSSVVRTERLSWRKRRLAIDLTTGDTTESAYRSATDYTNAYTRWNSRSDTIRLARAPAHTVVHVEDRLGNVIADTRIDGRFSLIGDEFLVGVVDKQFAIRNIRSVENAVISPTEFQDFSNVEIAPVDGFDRFIRRARVGNGTLLELYEIANSEARMISSWPAENENVVSCSGKIYNWKRLADIRFAAPATTNKPEPDWTIDVHDASGRILDPIDLPSPFNSGANKCKIIQNTVRFVDSVSNSVRYFDLERQQEIRLPAGCINGYTSPWDKSLTHFIGTYDLTTDRFKPPFILVTYDHNSRQLTSNLEIGAPFSVLGPSKSGNLLLASSAYGYSVIEVGPDGREVIQTHAPYAWAGWVMPLTALLFIAWAVYWVRCSIRDAGWAWIDCLLIGGFPLVCVWLRSLYVESAPLILVYQLGIYIGLLSTATIWLAMGQTRASLRFLVVAIIICLGIRNGLAVARDEQVAFPIVAITLITALALACFSRVARLCGLRFTGPGLPVSSGPSQSTIGGFFWTTLGIAILAMEFRSLARIGVTGNSGELAALALVGICCGLLTFAAAALALTRNRRLAVCTGVLSNCVAIAAVALPWTMFVYGFSPNLPANWLLVALSLTIPFAATFTLLLPYRLRGWRITRGSQVAASACQNPS
ncbi:MAG: hypothetical protein Aurels2KO_11130 [Aureliella sp.]